MILLDRDQPDNRQCNMAVFLWVFIKSAPLPPRCKSPALLSHTRAPIDRAAAASRAIGRSASFATGRVDRRKTVALGGLTLFFLDLRGEPIGEFSPNILLQQIGSKIRDRPSFLLRPLFKRGIKRHGQPDRNALSCFCWLAHCHT